MNTKMKILADKVNNTKCKGIEEYINESKKRLIEYYANDKRFEIVTIEAIENHDFKLEITNGAMRLKKQVELRKIVKGIETHKFAPELNCLHFKSGKTFRVKADNLEDAILYASIHLDAKQIESFKKPCLLKHFQ